MILDDRYWSKVTPAAALDCWLWSACLNEHGYGLFRHAGRSRLAHRLSYTYLRADIPTGLVLDHLCRVHACINPWHLEPVTRKVNSARGIGKAGQTHCKNNHELSGANLGKTNRGPGVRICLACKRCTGLDWYYRQRAAA